CKGIRGYDEHDSEERRESALRLRGIELEINRIAARPAGEARPRIGDEQQIRTDMRGVADVAAEEALHSLLRAPGEQRREPVEDDDGEKRKRPEIQPHEMRNDEHDPQEDRHARPLEVVVYMEPHRMRRRCHLPLKLGSLFSRNACTPSVKSSLCVATV